MITANGNDQNKESGYESSPKSLMFIKVHKSFFTSYYITFLPIPQTLSQIIRLQGSSYMSWLSAAVVIG